MFKSRKKIKIKCEKENFATRIISTRVYQTELKSDHLHSFKKAQTDINTLCPKVLKNLKEYLEFEHSEYVVRAKYKCVYHAVLLYHVSVKTSRQYGQHKLLQYNVTYFDKTFLLNSN